MGLSLAREKLRVRMAGSQSAKRLCQCWHAISGSLPAIGSITRTPALLYKSFWMMPKGELRVLLRALPAFLFQSEFQRENHCRLLK